MAYPNLTWRQIEGILVILLIFFFLFSFFFFHSFSLSFAFFFFLLLSFLLAFFLFFLSLFFLSFFFLAVFLSIPSSCSMLVLSSVDAALLILEDEIDILVDLAGHTGGNRLDVFAHKPAPVQITCVGYPNTTGLPQMDYRITDEYADPLSTTQQFSEELVRIGSGSFLCYTPGLQPEIASTPPIARNQYVTFGSFNNAAKMNERVFELWAKVLLAVPKSRLVLKCKAFASEEVKEELLARLARLGLSTDRVLLLSHKGEVLDHLLLYNSIDIALDTFPYAGTTTTVEAMYMGVPVVTLRGENHAHNVGVSLLTSVGPLVQDLIAQDENEFVAKAVELSRDEARIARIHANLRTALLQSRLCDRHEYIRHIMHIYRQAWGSWCDKNA
jgi:predicted O-linked N-acetylglucosamine transferase (SPINDLY family)